MAKVDDRKRQYFDEVRGGPECDQQLVFQNEYGP